LAVITALGGGITRDVLTQKGPPLAFLDVRYPLVALGGGILTLLFGFSASPHMSRFIWIADAASLGLFSVAGISRALMRACRFWPRSFSASLRLSAAVPCAMC
jgi:uncharacterized membrane protein YeiH